MMNFLSYFIVFNLVVAFVKTQAIIVPLGVVGVSIVLSLLYECYFHECCNDRWISLDNFKFYSDLNKRIYGQHLASDIVFKAIKGHLHNKAPGKALALSFNGMTGTGKNFAAKIIAENIYVRGMKSRFVKLIIATHHFKHRKDLENDKIKLKKWIVDTVTQCPRSLFIFDEMEKMHEELIDVLKPYLSHYPEVEGVDYRKAIFIFMGNTGADLIKKEVISNKKRNQRREDITIKQMDAILNKEALKKVGGFMHSTLLQHKLIDYFVPFLPLERTHVIQCIEDDIKEKYIAVSDHFVQRVANELLYFPDDGQWFSESGCKKVSSKVDHNSGW